MAKTNPHYDIRKAFTEQLSILTHTEYEHIFRILKSSGENYSENCNGIFFDVMTLKHDTFEKMNEYMALCMMNRQSDKTRLEQLNTYKSEMKYDNTAVSA